jgi:hypothetical protein
MICDPFAIFNAGNAVHSSNVPKNKKTEPTPRIGFKTEPKPTKTALGETVTALICHRIFMTITVICPIPCSRFQCLYLSDGLRNRLRLPPRFNF